MTAAISSSTPTANPAIAALSGATDASVTGTAESGAAAATGTFAALLLKVQMSSQKSGSAAVTDPALLLQAIETTEPEELQALGGEISALLPFLEAIGLPKQVGAPNEVQAIEINELPADAAALLPPGTEMLNQATAILAPAPAVPNAPSLENVSSAEMPQQAQAVASMLSGAGMLKPGKTETPSNMPGAPAGIPAIVADESATATTSIPIVAAPLTDPRVDVTQLRDPKIGGQTDFTAQLAVATTRTAAPAQTATEAPNITESLAPGHVQQPSQPGTNATFAPTDPIAAQRNTMPVLPVASPVGAPQWNQELGDKIVWMSNRQESRAELVLTPPQMGRVEVSLTVNGDQASAIFTSANPAVRDALEAAMPRLREVMAEAGIQLGQAQVGAENSRQSAQQEKNGDNFASGRHGANTDTALPQTMPGSSLAATDLKVGRGLVDVFA